MDNGQWELDYKPVIERYKVKSTETNAHVGGEATPRDIAEADWGQPAHCSVFVSMHDAYCTYIVYILYDA